MADRWYPVDTTHPPRNIRVRVLWAGRMFRASRVVHPKRKRVVWATLDKTGDVVFLPRHRDLERWGERPDAWQPETADKWRAALPEPLPLVEPRMWHQRASFDATAAAQEMEADRDQARGTGESPGRNRRRLWWLDVSAIEYRIAGEITRQQAEGRVMRALADDQLCDRLAGSGLDRAIPITDLMSIEDLRKYVDMTKDIVAPVALFKAFASDDADYDVAMAWFAALGGRSLEAVSVAGRRLPKPTQRQRVLWLAARPIGLTFEEIGDVINRSRQRAHELYRAAIDDIWQIANRFEHEGARRRDAALDAVRASNRRAAHSRGKVEL